MQKHQINFIKLCSFSNFCSQHRTSKVTYDAFKITEIGHKQKNKKVESILLTFQSIHPSANSNLKIGNIE